MLSSLVDRLLYVDGRIKIGPPVKSSSKFVHSLRSKMSQKRRSTRVPAVESDKMRANAISARDSTDTNRSVEMVNGVRMAQQLAEKGIETKVEWPASNLAGQKGSGVEDSACRGRGLAKDEDSIGQGSRGHDGSGKSRSRGACGLGDPGAVF